MKYAALLLNDAESVERWRSLNEQEAKDARAESLPRWNAFFESAASAVQWGAELGDPAQAKVVRVRDGETLVTDGPYAETKELLGGVLVLECGDLDEAIALADTIIVLSAGPHSRIRAVERVGIERPRDLLAVPQHPRFGELSASLWRQLYEEVRGQYGR